jgi:hypothetical protein
MNLREEMAKGWRILSSEDIHNLYASLNIIRTIKSRRTSWVGNVARMTAIMYTIFWSENLKGRDHSGGLGIDQRIYIRMDLREIVWEGTDWMHLAQDRDQ